MQNNENRLVPDFRQETTQTYTETYTPSGGTQQTATYKIGSAHPIVGGILDKLSWIRTHAAAVWWNKLAGVTLKSKIDAMDGEIAQLNGKMVMNYYPSMPNLKVKYVLISSDGDRLIITNGNDEQYDIPIGPRLVYDDLNVGDITIGANGYSTNLPKPSAKKYLAATVLAWQSNNTLYGIAGPNKSGNFQVLGIANSQIAGLEVRFWRYSE